MKIELREFLKRNHLTKTELAKKIFVTRPTLDKYLEDYENNTLREPYRSMLEEIFQGERNTSMEGKYRCLNNNIVVRIIDDTAVNTNGTKVCGLETRGKRDVVVGEIVACANTNIKSSAKVYFSFYAAQPFILEGESLYIVNYNDIKLIRED